MRVYILRAHAAGEGERVFIIAETSLDNAIVTIRHLGGAGFGDFAVAGAKWQLDYSQIIEVEGAQMIGGLSPMGGLHPLTVVMIESRPSVPSVGFAPAGEDKRGGN